MSIKIDKDKDISILNDPNAKAYTIQFYFNNKLLMPIELNGTDNLIDIRELLNNYSIIFFITSYHFEYNHKILPEMIELGKISELNTKAKIEIKLDLYDEFNAKMHVKKIQEFLSDPEAYYHLFGSNQQISYLNIFKNGINETICDTYFDSDEEEFNNKEKYKNLENEEGVFSKNLKNEVSLNKVLDTNLNIYFNISMAQKKPKLRLVKSLNFSGFNPPPSKRKLKGDYFYLHLKTLEDIDYQITCCPTGFYINNSTIKVYDWRPANQQIFYNLLDLFNAISSQYRDKFSAFTKLRKPSELKNEVINLKPISLYAHNKKWLADPEEYNYMSHENDNYRSLAAELNLLGFDPMTIRDWNEQTQMIKCLPKEEILQRLNRDKAFIKIHSEFVDSAIQGAKAVVDKLIQPLNPLDPIHQQMYIYNHIFYSYAIHTLESFAQEHGIDSSPTYTMSNIDLRNLRLLHLFDIPELGLLNSAIIDYKGIRILAQSIIPGVLNSDHYICNEYGTIDDGKTLNKNEEFMGVMKKVCEYFSLEDDIEFLDGENKIHNLAASFEIKGVRGSDRKKYLLDLMRLAPRDLNYKSEGSEYLCCVIRPELISQYANKKYYEMATEKLKKTKQEKNGEYKDLDQSINTKKNKELFATFQEIIESDMKYKLIKFNPSLYTRARLYPSPKLEEQKKALEDLANYIINFAIPALINEMIITDTVIPIDSRTLSDYMHSFGINIRYLGRIYSIANKKSIPFLKVLVERVIFVRSVKHVLKEYLHKIRNTQYIDIIVNILNCIFSEEANKSTSQHDNYIDHHNYQDLRIQYKQNGQQNGVLLETINDPNNTNSKNQKKYGENDSNMTKIFGILDSQDSQIEIVHIAPVDLWNRIKNIALKRYQHTLPNTINEFLPLSYPLTRLAILRDICLSNGIVLKPYHYNIFGNQNVNIFNNKDKQKDNKYPFTSDDIVDLIPVIKHLEPLSNELRTQIDLAITFLIENKIDDSIEQFLLTIDMMMNVFGPIHKDIAFCYTKLGQIYMKNGDKKQAIASQRQAILILEKFYGIDHEKTAHELSVLSSYYYSIQEYTKAIECTLRSLYIYNLIGGEYHPSGNDVLTHLSLLYKEAGKYQDSINCLFEVLERNIKMYGPDSFKVGNICQYLAIVHHALRDFIKAIEFQEKCVSIYKKIFQQDDIRIYEAESLLQKLQISLFDKNIPLQNKEIKKGIGQNKWHNPDSTKLKRIDCQFLEPGDAEEYQNTKEREKLLQKLKIAKLNAKYGMRRKQNLDLINYLNARTYDPDILYGHTKSKDEKNIRGFF